MIILYFVRLIIWMGPQVQLCLFHTFLKIRLLVTFLFLSIL